MSDYFEKYFNNDGFDFHRLINDDLINPVRILFKAKHYVSAIKLLMVAIDSVGYIEFGESENNPFIVWLDKYSKIEALSINSTELWEQRNSLLHMSNLNSRKVQNGKVRKLVGYIGVIPKEVNLANTETGYYDMQKLILEIGQSLNRWIATYDEEREKINQFVDRYDLIASDARMLHLKIDQ
jgi:hypothetical protein